MVKTTNNKYLTIGTRIAINKIGVAQAVQATRVQMFNSMETLTMTFAMVKINFSTSAHLWTLAKSGL